MPSSAQIKKTQKALLKWYAKHGRTDLPWRNTKNPYHIYISEIMLQQTQVKTVLEKYYTPFLKQFPTFKALSLAPLEDVLKAWEGLGYYTRARNLHAAAQSAHGIMPATVEGLLQLKGVGRNTAHAVACFAHGSAVPVVEANVKRIIARVYALKTLPKDDALFALGAELLNTHDPFTHNQAMMDIGALICTPKNPKCDECPLNVACEGKYAPALYPQKKVLKKTPVRKKNIVVLIHNKMVHVNRREENFLGGFYCFEEFERDEKIPYSHIKPIGSVTQTYSHFKLEADVLLGQSVTKRQINKGKWVDAKTLRSLPLSRADLKVLKLVAAHTDF